MTDGTEFPGKLPEDITTDRDGDGTWHAYITDTTGTRHLVANITENGTEFDIVLFDRYIEVNADSVYHMLMTCTPPATRSGTGWV